MRQCRLRSACASFMMMMIANNIDPDQTARMCWLIWVYAGRTCQKINFFSERLISIKSPDQGPCYPQTKSLGTIECFNGEQMPECDFTPVWDDVKLHVLNRLEDTCSLDAAQTMNMFNTCAWTCWRFVLHASWIASWTIYHLQWVIDLIWRLHYLLKGKVCTCRGSISDTTASTVFFTIGNY